MKEKIECPNSFVISLISQLSWIILVLFTAGIYGYIWINNQYKKTNIKSSNRDKMLNILFWFIPIYNAILLGRAMKEIQDYIRKNNLMNKKCFGSLKNISDILDKNKNN